MSFMSCTMTSHDEHASRFTASMASWQAAQPALNISILRLLAISLSCTNARAQKVHPGPYSKVKP
jgi:hypothetical protein